MKQSVQQIKRKQPAVVNKKQPKVTYLRPRVVSQSNHTRLANDKWERQADAVAVAITRGEKGLARRLTPFPAASKKVPGSRGEPLSVHLRKELEKGFGADLDAVRIHRDAAADAVVRAENARAFVAGPDIYLAAGEYGPESIAGRSILCHEIAHVLQQTGRPSLDGRMRATRVAGTGEIQRLEIDNKSYVEDNELTFSYLEDVYKVRQDPYFRSYAKKIKNTLIPKGKTEPDLLSKESAKALEKYINKNGYPEEKFLPFLYDCLKLTGNGERAAKLIMKYPEIKTRFWMHNMGSFAHEKFWSNWASFEKIYRKHSGLKSLWNLLIDTFRQMVFAPYRGRQAVNVKDVGTIKEVMDKFEEAGKDNTNEADNELFWGAAQVMFQVDNQRLDVMKKWAKGAGRYDKANIGRILILAHEIRKWAEGLSQSVHAGAAKIGTTVLEIAEQAVQHWNQVLMLGKNVTFKSLSDAEEGKVRLTPHKHFTEDLPKKVLSALKMFFKLGKNEAFPNSTKYAAQRDSVKKTLMGFSKSVLQMELLKIMRKKDPDENLALTYGFFMKWIESVGYILDRYSQTADESFEDEYGVNDIRFAHRARTAVFINNWLFFFKEGNLFAEDEATKTKNQWPSVETFMKPIMAFENQGKSQVALISDWEQDHSAEIKDLTDDFTEGIIELAPLNIHQIAKLYIALYYSQLDENIESLLKDERKENLSNPFGALKRDPIIKRALGSTNKPRRWIIADKEIALTPLDRKWVRTTPGERDPVMKGINSHPKTVRFVEQEKIRKPPHYVILPMDFRPTKEDPVFIWSLPPLENVVELLRNSKQKDSLNALVIKGSGLKATDVQNLSWQDWLKYLAKYLDEGDLDDYALAIIDLDKATEELHNEKKKDLKDSLQDLSTHERRLLSLRIVEVMRRYDRNDITTYEIPDLVLHALNQFGYFVNPPGDRFVQMAALVLSIVSALNTGLGAKKESFLLFFEVEQGAVSRYDVLNGYLSHLIAAKKVVSGKERKHMEKFLKNSEKALVDDQIKQLDILITAMKTQRRKQQTQFGFKAKAGDQTLKSFNFASEIKAGKDPFQVDGVTYRILKVYQDFEFIPSYGTKRSTTDTGEEGGYSPSILKVGGSERAVDKRKGQILFRVQIRDGKAFDIKDSDDQWLHEFNHVVSTRALIIGLENTAALIEASMELMLDLAELVPGAGQALMAARITASLIQFLTSDEFDAIKGMLSGDVNELIDRMVLELHEMLSPVGIMELLIFGNATLSRLAELGSSSKKTSRLSSKTRKSPIAQIFKAAMGLGKTVANALQKLESKVQTPVRGVQTYIVARPKLTWVMLFVARNAHKMNDLPSFNPAEIKANVEDSVAQFKQQLNDTFILIQTMEFPKEIIPIRLASKLIVSMLLERMGSKVRLAKRVIWAILDTTGSLDFIFGEIEDAVKGTAGDPNVYWQDFTNTHIDKQMKDSVNEVLLDVVTNLNKVSQGVFGSPIIVAQGNSAKLDDFQEEEMKRPEFELYTGLHVPDDGKEDIGRLVGKARTLPLGMRKDAERRFGHDFSHVRVFAGGEAAELTESFGAFGLTSGSFIFLKRSSDLPPTGASRVLDHELVHVLQQTGPRPLDRHHESQPRQGVTGEGLTYDLSREAEAEQIALEVRGRTNHKPVHIGSAGRTGVQPFPAEALRRILRKLASFEDVKELVEIITTEKVSKVPVSSRRYKYADALWGGLKTKISALGPTKSAFPGYLKKPAQTIIDYFKNNMTKIIDTTMLRKIAASALVEKIEKKKGKESKKTFSFRPNRFARSLEAVLLVEGGISFSINLADKYKKKMQKGESLSVPKDEDLIEEIKVKGIYLPSIGGTAGLWTSSMTAFGSDATTYQQKARETLRPHGPVNTILGTNEANEPQSITVFSAASTTLLFTSEFVAYIKRLAAGVSVLEDVPIVTDYVNSRAASPAGTVGLRVNTYGKHPGPHKDRQSHHTTQLLLMEYFRNDSNPKPFNKSKAYPGLKWSSGKPEKHKSILGEINFLNLAKGTRGDAMPAILLATRTHQKGGLHIKPTTSTDDDRTNRRATQGRTLHDKYDAKFKESMTSTGLKTDYFSHEKKSDAEFTAYLNGLTVTEQDKVGDATHNAMQATYQWVHGKMLPALERALEQHEVPYYREIALKKKERRKGDSSTDLIDAYDMKGANVHPVYRHAVENNDTVMQGEGWLA